MASIAYNKWKYLALKGLDLESEDIRALVVNDAYVPSAAHNFVSEVVAYELNGTGYERKAITGATVTEDDGNNRAVFDADDLTYSGIDAGKMAYIIIYRHNESDAAAELLFCIDIADVTTNGSDVTVQWASAGIVELT